MKITHLLLAFSALSPSVLAQEAVPPVPAAPNIVRNEGFELNPKNELPPTQWYVFNAPVVTEKLLWDAAQKHEGQYSLRLSNANAEDYPNVFQVYDLAPGKYRFSGWVKGEKLSGTNTDDQGAGIYIEMYTADESWEGGDYPVGVPGTFEWKKIESTFTVTDKTVKQRIGLYLRKGTTGTAWFDDLSIEKVEETAPAK